MNVAAVDCGTNSTRLLIADEKGARVVEELRITRLGEGVHANRSLLPAAIERTCNALREFRELLIEHEAIAVRAVATSAVRDASNSAEFLSLAHEALGSSVEVISGDEEAALTYAGATSSRDPDRWHLVIDIGGGSTEFVLGHNSEVAFAKSFDLGCVRLTEQFLTDDPPSESQLKDARAAIEATIGRSELLAKVDGHNPDLIAVAGTATSLAAIDLGLDRFDAEAVHGHVLSIDVLEALHRRLAGQKATDRVSGCLPIGRAEVITGGTVVLVTAMRMLGIENCTISTADLLTGTTFALVADAE